MLESSEVEDGGSTMAIGSTYSSAGGSPVEGGGGGALEVDYSKAFRASSHLSSSLPKEGGTYGSYNIRVQT